MDDAEAEDIQRAIHLSLSLQGEPQDESVAGPSNCPPPPISTIPPPPPPLPLSKSTPQEVHVDSLSRDYDAPSLTQLQAMLGDPQASFRSPAQYFLYKKLLARDCHLVSVSATGSGKTLPFQLAMKSWTKDIRGIMVLPYQILHGDMKRRMVEVGLSCRKWTEANPTPMEQVVTISIESFCSPACLGWLQDVARSGRLGTIMFDEAHGLVEDVRFREAYGTSIRRLLEIRGCTIMFCSATLSPHFMQDFWRHLKIDFRPEDSILTVRSPTQRPNIFYQVLNLGLGTPPPWKNEVAHSEWQDKWIQASVKIIKAAGSYLGPDERGLVFFVNQDDCHRWGNALQCPYITGKVDNAERERNFANWYSGKSKVLCLNKAGYYGFDFPRARFAIMVGAPMCMTDYMQSSGRIGRDGVPSMCLTLIPHLGKEPSPQDQENFSGRKAIRQMVCRGMQCLRLIPSQHMDGRDETCMELYERDGNTVICSECFYELDVVTAEELKSEWTKPWSKH